MSLKCTKFDNIEINNIRYPKPCETMPLLFFFLFFLYGLSKHFNFHPIHNPAEALPWGEVLPILWKLLQGCIKLMHLKFANCAKSHSRICKKFI
jgi:hypothetical protein